MAKEAKKPAKAVKPPKAEAQELITIDKKALSLEVGPVVIAALAKTYEQEEKAHELIKQVDAKRYDLQAMTTQAVVKVFANDSQVNSADAFSNDRKTVQRLNDQILLAMGVREYVPAGKGNKQKLVWAKAVAKMFPQPKDKKDDPATVKKATLRSNFIHMLKKCTQAATAIVDNKLTATMDEKAGTLRIAGPSIEKTFGAKEVLLNEKQKQGDKELTARPSYTALANMAAADHGVPVKSKSNDRTTKQVVDPELAIESLANSFVKAIERIGSKPTDRQRKALESVRSAIDACLD